MFQRREAELLAQCIAINKEEGASAARKEAKEKLMGEISGLQAKCQEMREDMARYKEKQEAMFSKLSKEKETERVEFEMLKSRYEYEQKFIEVFMNMVIRLPVPLEDDWSHKRKIAVGWRAVKYLVRRALKLGIKIPLVSHTTSIG